MSQTIYSRRHSACIKDIGISEKSPSDLVREIRRGIPIKTVAGLQACFDVSEAKFAGVAHIALRTLARRKRQGKLGVDESERVVRLTRLFKQAVDVLGSIEAARKWFKMPNRALGQATPFDYSDTEPGAREVEDILGRIEHGVFA